MRLCRLRQKNERTDFRHTIALESHAAARLPANCAPLHRAIKCLSPMNLDRDEMLGAVNALNTRLREPAGFAVFNLAMAVISLVVGSAFILVGGWWIHHLHMDEFIFNRATAQGQIVQNKPVYVASRSAGRGFFGGTFYRAIVRFTAPGGRDVTVDDWIALDPPSFRVGQSVNLFYDPADPQHAMIDRGWKNYVAPGFPGVMGFLMILGGLLRLFKPRAPPA